MDRVLITDDGKRVIVNTKTDVCLYETPCNPPNPGTDYTRGTDLYAHRARSGNVYFYLHHWSLWQRESSWLELVDRHEALDFLLEKARLTNVAAMDEDEIETAKEFGFNILEETA
jgi:hypothetical protein